MPADEAPDDESSRQTYNFAPGSHGLIYRADTSERAAGGEDAQGQEGNGEPSPRKAKVTDTSSQSAIDGRATKEVKYKLQAAKWGLIPFWTKRPPDYGSQMRTINCRDDSLMENRGMWNTMKQRKRCVVVAEGFFEWLKKNNGKEKVPHYTKRADGQLMCFAGLWDMVQYEDSEEKLYTYTIITTDSNKQLRFLHDRMPVILEPGSDEMKAWLDPNNIGWSKELQSILRPYGGDLECYPVDKAVGKVGNNSPSFVIPINSKENKSNIANFFATQRATATEIAAKNVAAQAEVKVKREQAVKQESDERRDTESSADNTETNAPLPKPNSESKKGSEVEVYENPTQDNQEMSDIDNGSAKSGIKRERSDVEDEDVLKPAVSPPKKAVKVEQPTSSPTQSPPSEKPVSSRKTRSATSNNTTAKAPTKSSNAKITSFFGK